MFVRESFVCFQFESKKNSGRKAVFAEKDVVLAQKDALNGISWVLWGSPMWLLDLKASRIVHLLIPIHMFWSSNPCLHCLHWLFRCFQFCGFQQGDQHDRLSSEWGSRVSTVAAPPCWLELRFVERCWKGTSPDKLQVVEIVEVVEVVVSVLFDVTECLLVGERGFPVETLAWGSLRTHQRAAHVSLLVVIPKPASIFISHVIEILVLTFLVLTFPFVTSFQSFPGLQFSQVASAMENLPNFQGGGGQWIRPPAAREQVGTADARLWQRGRAQGFGTKIRYTIVIYSICTVHIYSHLIVIW